MRYAFDIDNTLVDTIGNDYLNSRPIQNRIDDVNRLYDDGHVILLFTARGSASGKDYRSLTEDQMKRFGVKHHELIMGKPNSDVFIDDKAISSEDWRTHIPNKRVVWTNGCFDVLHIGHIRMLSECVRQAKIHDARLVVGIDSDARIRATKGETRPINSESIRSEFLHSIRGIDSVVIFDSDDELLSLISNLKPEVMIVGDDYENKPVIGNIHAKTLIFFPRVYGYSTTNILKGKSNESSVC